MLAGGVSVRDSDDFLEASHQQHFGSGHRETGGVGNRNANQGGRRPGIGGLSASRRSEQDDGCGRNHRATRTNEVVSHKVLRRIPGMVQVCESGQAPLFAHTHRGDLRSFTFLNSLIATIRIRVGRFVSVIALSAGVTATTL